MSSDTPNAPLVGTEIEVDPARLSALHVSLIAWYEANARELPWRQTRDPYHILVAEVMLQQIQVARAIPFYLAFLDRFPSIPDLAGAPLAEVIRVWGDLGRYRRIVALHRTAKRIVDEFGGVVPDDVATLRSLPGVGPYTAGAIACFAFEQDVGFLDTNSRRVLHRLFVGVDAPVPTAQLRDLHRLAETIVPRGRGWVWNQALIEFGALHCTARRPQCTSCPLKDGCRAFPMNDRVAAGRAQRGAAMPSSRYEGTNRYFRGRVLAELRDLPTNDPAGIDLRSLGGRLRADFSDEELPWIAGVVESLRKDGLAAVSAIAEERPAYDVGGVASDEEIEVRVSLPVESLSDG